MLNLYETVVGTECPCMCFGMTISKTFRIVLPYFSLDDGLISHTS